MWYASPCATVRRTKATLIYGRTGNCGSAASTGHKKIENTAPYLGIEVDEGLAIAKQVASELQRKADWFGPFPIATGVPYADLPQTPRSRQRRVRRIVGNA
jgi:hypothetical protein